jgi:hypothetical protein
MTAPHDLDVLAHDELAGLLDGAPWRRLAAVGDGDVSWLDPVAGTLAEASPALELLVLPQDGLEDAVAFQPDLAIIAAAARPAELEPLLRRLHRAGADVLMIEPADRRLAAVTRSLAMQHGAPLVRPGDTDAAVVATEVVRCLAAALDMWVAA